MNLSSIFIIPSRKENYYQMSFVLCTAHAAFHSSGSVFINKHRHAGNSRDGFTNILLRDGVHDTAF